MFLQHYGNTEYVFNFLTNTHQCTDVEMYLQKEVQLCKLHVCERESKHSSCINAKWYAKIHQSDTKLNKTESEHKLLSKHITAAQNYYHFSLKHSPCKRIKAVDKQIYLCSVFPFYQTTDYKCINSSSLINLQIFPSSLWPYWLVNNESNVLVLMFYCTQQWKNIYNPCWKSLYQLYVTELILWTSWTKWENRHIQENRLAE